MDEPRDVPIHGQTIRLDQFLQRADLAQTGGHAKIVIQAGEVRVNGEVESRRRRTLQPGDVVQMEGETALRVKSQEAQSE